MFLFFIAFFIVSNFEFGWHAESCRLCGQSKGKVLGEPLLALLGFRGVHGGFLCLRRASGQKPQRQTNKKLKLKTEARKWFSTVKHIDQMISYSCISLYFCQSVREKWTPLCSSADQCCFSFCRHRTEKLNQIILDWRFGGGCSLDFCTQGGGKASPKCERTSGNARPNSKHTNHTSTQE